MLTRIVIFAIVVALAVMLYRRIQAGKNPAAAPTQPAASMKKCAHCGIHLPEAEALKSGEHFFCTDAHRLAFDQQHSKHD